MRAYKTVNDSWIEPISFTVPRRAETFQSDIFPPAPGVKPAVSAAEWLEGKSAIPSKIDLESIYEGHTPVEVAADYKPPASILSSPPAAAPAPTPAAAPAPQPSPKKEPEPAQSPVAARAPPNATDQKASISAMANKYQDQEESSSDAESNATSSFEEIGRPENLKRLSKRASYPRPLPVNTTPPGSRSPVRTPRTSVIMETPVPPSVTKAVFDTLPTVAPEGVTVEVSLEQIKQLLVQQAVVITSQTEKISAQTQIISKLVSDVETLKKKVGAGSQEQSERIRQLELELEEARS